jgi:glutathione S-transferase
MLGFVLDWPVMLHPLRLNPLGLETGRVQGWVARLLKRGAEDVSMLTLYSYPDLFGVADNNPFGLKVYAFLKLCGLPFCHKHILDASKAPRGQLPYIVDGELLIGDSDSIVSHLISRSNLQIDGRLTSSQHDSDLLIRRMLDDLYWVMSYSRWKDGRFYPLFRNAILQTHRSITAEALDKAREYNLQRYHYQGVGRYEPDAVYRRGIENLRVLANLVPASGFLFGEHPSSIDASIYGFVANIYFYEIDTPLKRFVVSQPRLVRHCLSVHELVQR